MSKAPDGWTEEKLEPEVWRERFYILGTLWIPEEKYREDDAPVSIHFDVYETWKADDGSQRFKPYNVETTVPDEDYIHFSMSIKWDGCSDLNFGDDFAHFCSASEAWETAELLKHLYEVAEGYFPEADAKDFEVKA